MKKSKVAKLRTFLSVMLVSTFLSCLSKASEEVGTDLADQATSENKAKNESQYKYNISFEPVLLLVGNLILAADFRLTEDWTLGPIVNYYHESVSGNSFNGNNISVDAYQVGARATWFASGILSQTWYVSPSLSYVNARGTTTESGVGIANSLSEFGISLDGGYNWFWDGFNVRLGAGFKFLSGPSKVHVQNSDGTRSQDVSYTPTQFGADVDFMLGWAF